MQTGRYYVVDQIEQAFYDLMKEKVKGFLLPAF